MALDPRHSLALAFQHLELFSVPGIGTFRKVRTPAVIDHQAGKILPPAVRFELEPGFDYVGDLQDFLFRYHDLNIADAKILVEDIQHHLQADCKASGRFVIPSVGTLLESEGKYQFVDSSGTGLASAGQFFGLPELTFTIGQRNSTPSHQDRQETAKKIAAMKDAPVEAAPRPVRGKGKSKALRNVAIILLLLVMGGSLAGIIWQDKFQVWMQENGWIVSGNPEKSDTLVSDMTASKENEVPVIDTTSETYKELQAVQPEETVVEAVKPVVVQPKPVVEEVKPIETPTDLEAWDGMGEYAQTGVYYLVVGARSGAEGAREVAQSISKGGIQAKVLVPRTEGPHYKVVVFQSKQKSAVIQKMVEWKDRFPEKSWIFWVGM